MKTEVKETIFLTCLVIMFLAGLFLILTSCTKKETEDFREKVIGTWEGTVTWNIPGINWTETRINRARIIMGCETNDIGINTLGVQYYAIAHLENDSYRYYPFEVGGYSISIYSTTLATIYGRGWIEGDSLIEKGTVTISTNGVGHNGTWETKMKRVD